MGKPRASLAGTVRVTQHQKEKSFERAQGGVIYRCLFCNGIARHYENHSEFEAIIVVECVPCGLRTFWEFKEYFFYQPTSDE